MPPAWPDRLHVLRFRLLLGSLLVLLGVVPLAAARDDFDLVFALLLTLVVLAGLLSMRRDRLLLGVAILLGAPILVSRWAAALVPGASPDLVAALVPVSFFAFFTVFLLRAVVTADEVTGDVIAGALSVYLLLGLTWSLVYQGLALADPAAFQAGAAPLDRTDFLYYSFITLATVGYGDITPASPLAQTLAYAEAVTGVLYVAVLVARLVSAYRR